MATHDTVVIGASAGGVQALTTLVRGLPGNLPAVVLGRESHLPVAHPQDGEEIRRGRAIKTLATDS